VSDPWIPALTAIVVAIVSALTAWATRKDTREGDFREDYLERLDKAERRAEEAYSKYEALLARLADLDEENARLRGEVATLRAHVARLERTSGA
jgi:predicted nuclease with TOPRIM domain